MKFDEFNAQIKLAMESVGDQAQLSTILSGLSDVYSTKITEVETATTTATQLTSDNEKLRKANMDLFLKVGADVTKQQDQQKVEDDTPTFDDLFDEKGNLK